MRKYLILVALIFGLASFSTCSAMMAISAGAPGTQGTQAPSLTPQQVINIRVSRIQNGQIYAKDGQKFDISGAQVVNDNPSRSRIDGAELDYVNGQLVQVILK